MENFGEVRFMDTLSRPAGIKQFVNKMFDVLDAADYFPAEVATSRLDKGQLICPLHIVQYKAGKNGKKGVILVKNFTVGLSQKLKRLLKILTSFFQTNSRPTTITNLDQRELNHQWNLLKQY